MKVELTLPLIDFLLAQAYQYVIVSTKCVNKANITISITLKPVEKKPSVQNLPAGFDTYFYIKKEPLQMAKGVDETEVMVELCSTDLLGYKDYLANLTPASKRKRVLVLDDDSAVLEAVGDALVYENFDVKTVKNSTNILKSIEDYHPDVVLIDYILDGINGGEICHQIKTNKSTHFIPVMIMSGYPKVFTSLGTYGCDSFIAKPFDLSNLIESINDCINQSKLIQLIN